MANFYPMIDILEMVIFHNKLLKCQKVTNNMAME
jgi:hypothetical protein